MKLQLAPHLSLEGVPKTLRITDILGLPTELIGNTVNSMVLYPYPAPVVRKLAEGMYQLMHSISWLEDIRGCKYSQVHCFVIDENVGEVTIQKAMVVMEIIHNNRAIKKLPDVLNYLRDNPKMLEIIKESYDIDSLRGVAQLFSRGLANERTMRRIVNRKKSPQRKTQIEESHGIKSSNELDDDRGPKDLKISEARARHLWERLKIENPDVWSFDTIVNSFGRPDQATERLVERIRENPNDLQAVWETVKQGLRKRGIYHD